MYSTSSITNILPRLIEDGRIRPVAQSRFLMEIEKTKKSMMINPTGLNTPITTAENSTFFAVAEGGPILSGAAPEHEMGLVQLRQHWSSLNFTGSLERIQTQYLTNIRMDDRYAGMSLPQLMKIAGNFAVKELVWSTLSQYARRENFFALQGTDKSAIGVVTGLPGGNVAQFSWDTTNQGNRMFKKNLQVQFFSPGGVQRVAGLATIGSSLFNMVLSVDSTPAAGATGPVTFAEAVPTNAAIGDTVVARNTYGMMPLGFIHYIDDVGLYKGIPRAINPEVLSSVITRLTGSPTISPSHYREQMSQMESRSGYGIPFAVQIWMNKTQEFNFESQLYGAGFLREIGPSKVDKIDLAPADMYWDGHKFMTDVDVPPGHINFINMLSWRKVSQTPLQSYEFDSGSRVVNPINSFGERLDQRQATIFSEYNWDCTDPRTNGRIEGASFNRIHV